MLNKVILMGRLVADPELKQTPNGTSVATCRVAVERNYAGQDKQRQVDFISCVAWRQTGEFIARYFAKGGMIALEGSLQSRQYEDKTGQKRTVYEVVAERAYFCGNKEGSASQQPSSFQESGGNDFQPFNYPEAPYDDGDLPY